MPLSREQFYARVDQTGECWLWLRCWHSKKLPYGRVWDPERRQTVQAHRMAWEIECGPIPDGVDVLHSCDNPPCVRWTHLFLGTDQDNATDKLLKGRQARGVALSLAMAGKKATGEHNGSRTHPERRPRGEANTRSKTTMAQVRAMRARYAEGGITQAAVGWEFCGLSQQQTSKILAHKFWKDE